VPEREPDERAAGVRVGVRRPLAGEVRLEEQALRARLPLRGLGVQLVVAAAHDVVVEPLQ